MIQTSLAVLGKDVLAQDLLLAAKANTIPYQIKSTTKNATFIYVSEQKGFELEESTATYIWGHENHSPKMDIKKYAKQSFSISFLLLHALHKKMQLPWQSIVIDRHVGLAKKANFSFEFLQVLQSLRLFFSDEISKFSVTSVPSFVHPFLRVSFVLGECQIEIRMLASKEENSAFHFYAKDKKIEVNTLERTYKQVQILQEEVEYSYSFHADTQAVAINELFSSVPAHANILTSDWEFINAI